MDRCLRLLQQQESSMLQLLEEIVTIETPSHDKRNNDLLGELIKNSFEKMIGGKTEMIEDQKYGNHLKCAFGEGDKQILLVAHLDTVHPIGTLQSHPFKIENKYAYGPGIYDMKTGVVQMLFALHVLKEANAGLNKRVVCLFNTDEEVGSPHSKKYIEKEAAKSDVAFVLEPSYGINGAIKMARMGVGSYKLSTEGKSAHAGLEPQKGVNAIEELSRQVLKLQALNNNAVGSTVNCGTIIGGTSKNTIPEHAELLVDARAQTIKESKELHQQIIQLKAVNELVQLTVEGKFGRLPMEKTTKSHGLYTFAKEKMMEYFQLSLPAASVGGGSDGNTTSVYTTTLDGLGAVGSGAHTLTERVDLSHLIPRTMLLILLIEHVSRK